MRTKTRALLVAITSAMMLAITATGANAEVSAAADVTLGNPEGCYYDSETPDNCTVNLYYGGSKFGDVTWNDYADADHGDDVDNIYLQDRDGDGYYIRVTARNTNGGEVVSNSDSGGSVDTISFSRNVPSGYAVEWYACIKKDGETIKCGGPYWFVE
jgi:hypothetical protein